MTSPGGVSERPEAPSAVCAIRRANALCRPLESGRPLRSRCFWVRCPRVPWNQALLPGHPQTPKLTISVHKPKGRSQADMDFVYLTSGAASHSAGCSSRREVFLSRHMISPGSWTDPRIQNAGWFSQQIRHAKPALLAGPDRPGPGSMPLRVHQSTRRFTRKTDAGGVDRGQRPRWTRPHEKTARRGEDAEP